MENFLQVITSGTKCTILHKDGRDVTKTIHDLPSGTIVVIRREDGHRMDAVWDGNRISLSSKCKIFAHLHVYTFCKVDYIIKVQKRGHI